jgi:hypothetical protein
MDYEDSSTQNAQPFSRAEPLPDWLNLVRTQVDSLKFGTVQITVHDSKVVKIERNESCGWTVFINSNRAYLG